MQSQLKRKMGSHILMLFVGKKIKILIVFTSDFYFTVAICTYYLYNQNFSISLNKNPLQTGSQVAAAMFLLQVASAEMESQAGRSHEGSDQAKIPVLGRKLR